MMTGESVRSAKRRLLLLSFALLPLLLPAADIPCEWTGIDHVVAVADLHGDYDRFVYILSHPQIDLVDADLHWKGGATHLVQLGDILDRGQRAKDIFDFLMRLEKEAAAAGGMVHVLLGNHEEMNITGIAMDYPGYVNPEQYLSFVAKDFREEKDEAYIKTLPPEAQKRAEIETAPNLLQTAFTSSGRRARLRERIQRVLREVAHPEERGHQDRRRGLRPRRDQRGHFQVAAA